MTPDKDIIVSYLLALAGVIIGGFSYGRKYQKRGHSTYAAILYIWGSYRWPCLL